MAVSNSTVRLLEPFMSKDTIEKLHAGLVLALDSAREGNEPASFTADLMMTMCCDEVIRGWQNTNPTQREKTFDQSTGIECDVRVSKITPTKSQIVAACQGPTESLGGMRSKVIASVRRAVKKELK